MAAPYFLSDTNIYSTLQINGWIEAVINLHVLQPDKVFSALGLKRPLVQGRIEATLGILERESHHKLHDFWTILQRFTFLHERYDYVFNATFRLQHQPKGTYVLLWTSQDILWGTVRNMCIYDCMILGAYTSLM